MDFIVLTYDDRLSFTELMIRSYLDFFPKFDITFNIPYNNDETLRKIKLLPGNITPIKCKKEMKPTMSALLGSIPDNKFVYWCSDDRYVASFKDAQRFRKISKTLSNNASVNLDAVRTLTIPAQHRRNVKIKLDKNLVLFKFSDSVVHGFWNHHFIRCKWLKDIFINNNLPENYELRDLHKLMGNRNKQYNHRIYTVGSSICVFGETTYHDKMTINCRKAMNKYGIQIPEYPSDNIKIFFDGRPRLTRVK